MSRLKQRLISRLKRDLGIDLGDPDEWQIKRTRAGWHQKSAGALSWFIQHKTSYQIPIGGNTALSRTMKWKKWEVYRHHDPGFTPTIEEGKI